MFDTHTKASRPESFPHLFRRKIRNISGLDTDTEVLFKPPPGRQFVVLSGFVKVKSQVGTNTDAPGITIDNGTDGNNVVAAVDLLVAEGAVQRLAIVGNFVIDYDNPLRLKKAEK